MSLLDDAKALDNRRPAECTVCVFIEEQPPDRQAEFDELLNARDRKGYVVGNSAAFKVLAREGYQYVTPAPISTHRERGHRA